MPEIAKMLAVDAIVEGSLVQEGHQIRVHAQLIRAARMSTFGQENTSESTKAFSKCRRKSLGISLSRSN